MTYSAKFIYYLLKSTCCDLQASNCLLQKYCALFYLKANNYSAIFKIVTGTQICKDK